MYLALGRGEKSDVAGSRLKKVTGGSSVPRLHGLLDFLVAISASDQKSRQERLKVTCTGRIWSLRAVEAGRAQEGTLPWPE